MQHASQEAEATQIKEGMLRHHWTSEGFEQWANANLLLTSARAEMEALKVSATASNASQAGQVRCRLACRSDSHSSILFPF